MKAFISYSLNDTDQYILSILANKLKIQGFTVTSSYNLNSRLVDFETFTQLNKSSLFIGIITYDGTNVHRVYKEWQTAIKSNIPAILLIEDIQTISQDLISHPNIIRFNRTKPESAIEYVRVMISNSKIINPQKNNDAIAWILGGIAILALIDLLTNDD